MTSLHTKLKELRELREKAPGTISYIEDDSANTVAEHCMGVVSLEINDNDHWHLGNIHPKQYGDLFAQAANNWLTILTALEKAVSALDEIQYESCTTDDTMDDRLKLENRITKKAWKALAEIAEMLKKD